MLFNLHFLSGFLKNLENKCFILNDFVAYLVVLIAFNLIQSVKFLMICFINGLESADFIKIQIYLGKNETIHLSKIYAKTNQK